jgi:hypothetical protein
MRVHDVAGKSAVYYPHHKDASFISHRLYEEISRTVLISQMWNIKFKCAKPFPVHVRKFEGISY